MNLTFSVNHQIITRTDTNSPVSDTVDFINAVFTFATTEWTGKTKTAIFKSKNGNYEVILTNDSCVIPWEVLVCKYFSVSVYAGNLITTNSVTVEQIHSGYVKGQTPADPTETIYQQIIGMIEDISTSGVTISQASGNIIQLKTDGIYATGAQGPKGDTGAQGPKGDKGDKGDTGSQGATGAQGPKGDKGDKGDAGDTYTITSADYTEIANVVYDMFQNAEDQEV